MRDSQDNIDQRLRAMVASKTPAERLRMASGMFDTARALILAGTGEKHGDVRGVLFNRLYAVDFSDNERGRILKHIAQSSAE